MATMAVSEVPRTAYITVTRPDLTNERVDMYGLHQDADSGLWGAFEFRFVAQEPGHYTVALHWGAPDAWGELSKEFDVLLPYSDIVINWPVGELIREPVRVED